jgi:hypothetical protein
MNIQHGIGFHEHWYLWYNSGWKTPDLLDDRLVWIIGDSDNFDLLSQSIHLEKNSINFS